MPTSLVDQVTTWTRAKSKPSFIKPRIPPEGGVLGCALHPCRYWHRRTRKNNFSNSGKAAYRLYLPSLCVSFNSCRIACQPCLVLASNNTTIAVACSAARMAIQLRVTVCVDLVCFPVTQPLYRSATPCNNTVFYVAPGETLEFQLSAYQVHDPI
eukprot:8769419-Pyramimonas_sp.AAC.2